MKNLPIGIEDFKTLIDKDYYFADKTKWIEDAIKQNVTFYTYPRRFGKSLNMSMLYYFFSNKEKENAYLFNGLEISHNLDAMKSQNQYPVISITLKDLSNTTFDEQIEQFRVILYILCDKFQELLNSDQLRQDEKDIFSRYLSQTSTITEIKNSLFYLTNILYKHYGQKVIVLIDEYDVPLQKAYLYGYYDEMVNFLRSLFSSAFKTNIALEKAIFTGCLRIAKESIFTGFNNFVVDGILNTQEFQAFGFTNGEVDQLLEECNLTSCKDTLKEWYDGYLFGGKEIYNPWSTLNYLMKCMSGNTRAESYWANSSGNDIVYNYLNNSTEEIRDDFESLIHNQPITKRIKPELTYREMDDINNVYSFLLFTGYLKVVGIHDNDTYDLAIPNKEVKKIYEDSFMDYTSNLNKKYKDELYQAFISKDDQKASLILNEILVNSISYYDSKESFYHGFLVGLLQGYSVESNKESGDGRFDIIVKPRSYLNNAVIIECKVSNDMLSLEKDAEVGTQQIIEKNYKQYLKTLGYDSVVGYGIAFCKKKCVVKVCENL